LGTTLGANGFSGQTWSGDSINAMGNSGSISVTVTSPSFSQSYFQDANYSSGASTYLAPTGGLSVAGSMRTTTANSITYGNAASPTVGGPVVAGPISVGGSTQNITIGGVSRTIDGTSMVTPAEWLAFVQIATGGPQTVTLSGTTVGTGFASGGSFNIAAINVPSSNFSNLNLPTGVTANSSVNLTYTGSAIINGTLNTSSTALNVGTTASVGGTVSFTNSVGGTFTTGSDLSGTGTVRTNSGTLNLATTSGNIFGSSIANPLSIQAQIVRVTANGGTVRLSNNQLTYIGASNVGANGILDVRSPDGIVTLGDVNNSATPAQQISLTANGGNQFIVNSGIPRTLFADTVNLTTSGDSIGVLVANQPILLAANNVILSNGAANAFINNSNSAAVTTTGTIGSLNYVQTGANNVTTVGATGINISGSGNVSITSATGTNGGLAFTGAIAGAGTVSLGTDGTGTMSGTGLITANQVNIQTGGGNIGTSGAQLNLSTPTLNVRMNSAGTAFISDNQSVNLTSGTGTSGTIGSLTLTKTLGSGSITVGSAGITNTGVLTLQGAAGTDTSININGGITRSGFATTSNLTATGTGVIARTGTGSIDQGNVNLVTAGGDIGATGTPILMLGTTLNLQSNSTGNAFITSTGSSIIHTGSGAAGSIGSLTYTQNATSGTRDVLGRGSLSQNINATGNITVQQAGSGTHEIDIEGTVTSTNASTGTISLTTLGGGQITNNLLGFGPGTLAARNINMTTTGGAIGSGTDVRVANNSGALGILTIQTGSGSANITSNGTSGYQVNTGAAGSVGNLTYTANGGGANFLGSSTNGISSSGNVIFQGVSSSVVQFAIRNFVTTNSASQITISGTGSGNIINDNGGGLLTAGTVNLRTEGTNIANSFDRIRIDAPIVTVGTNGTGLAAVSNAQSFNLTSVGTGVSLIDAELTATNGNITVGTSGITATGGTSTLLGSGTNNGMTFAGDFNGGSQTINVFASGTGTINKVAGSSATITAGTLNLLALGGSVGTSGNELLTAANNVNVATSNSGTTGGDAYLNSSTAVNLTTNVLTGDSVQNLVLTSSGAVTLGTATLGVKANGDATIQAAAGSSANIDVLGNVQSGPGANTVNLITNGTGIITSSAGTSTITSFNLNLYTGGGDIGQYDTPTTNAIYVNAGNIDLKTNGLGDAHVINVGTGFVGTNINGTGSVKVFDYATDGASGTTINIHQNGVTSTGEAIIRATGNGSFGSINFEGDVNAGSNKITLIAEGVGGSITEGNFGFGTGTLTGSQVEVQSGGASIIGGVGAPILINTPILTVSNNGMGNAYFSDSQSVTVTTGAGAAGAVNNLTVTQTGSGQSIIVGAAGIGVNNAGLGGGILTLQGATGSNANIVINGNIQSPTGGNYTGITNLTVEGTGTITDPTGAGRVLSTNVNFTTGGGDIGTDPNPVLISSNAVTVQTNSAGNAFISNNLASAQIVSTGTGAAGSVGNLTYTATTGIPTLGSATNGINATGNLVFQGLAGQNIPIVINNTVTTSNASSITLQATGAGGITSNALANVLTAGTVNLISSGTFIGSGGTGRIVTDTPVMVVSTGTGGSGSAFVQSNQSVNLTTVTGERVGSLDYLAGAPGTTVTVGTNGIASAGGVAIANTAGENLDINLTGGITSTSGSVNLAITGAAGSISGLGQIQAQGGGAGVTLRADNGNIGGAGANLNLSTGSITANAGQGVGAGPSSVYLNNDRIANLNASSATSVFQLNNPADLNIVGNLTVNNATDGGTIQLYNTGTLTVGAAVTANGTTGNGGTVLFSNQAAGNPLNVVINGSVGARNTANTSGRVGFNGGATGDVTVTGGGTVSAGEFVGFGDVDNTSLAVSGGQVIPTTNSFTSGISSVITVNLGGNILNQIMSTQLPPPVPPVVVPGSGTGSGGPGGLFTLAQLNALLAAQQAAQLNSIIGTRTATDFTPIDASNLQASLYTLQHKDPKTLEGNVVINKRDNETLHSALFHGAEFSDEQLDALRNNGVIFGSNTGGNFFNLDKGYVVFAPTQDITVQTHEGNVHIAAGSTAYVMETGNDVSVYNLHDTRKGGVQIVSNNKLIVVQPGTQVLLTRNPNAHFDHLNPGKDIGHRKAHNKDLGAGITAHISEFSIIGAFSSVPALREMIKSDNKAQQKLAHKMIKNAVILMALNPKGLPYKSSGNSNPNN
jgi:hypothetical protein